LIYAGVGVAGVVLGGHFLDFRPLLDDPQYAQQFGIVTVELGIGITVSTVTMLIFTMFVQRRADSLEAGEND